MSVLCSLVMILHTITDNDDGATCTFLTPAHRDRNNPFRFPARRPYKAVLRVFARGATDRENRRIRYKISTSVGQAAANDTALCNDIVSKCMISIRVAIESFYAIVLDPR